MSRRHAVFEIGDALLFTVSARRRCTWQAFRDAFDDLYTRWVSTTGRSDEPDVNVRRDAARLIDALGHCDVVFGAGNASVFAAPSVLAQLPVAGLPRAVLCGSRSPESIGLLRRATHQAGNSVHVRVESQRSSSLFAPARIEIQANSDAVMRRVAEEVGVLYATVPPAWSLASMSGALDGFHRSLGWSKRPDLNWARSDFDPGQLRFGGRRESSDRLILSRYQDPVRGGWIFWMWRGDECAEIGDPSWGRYAVLAACGRTVLRYDQTSGQLMVPASVPLPRLLSRAATLCSGYAPATIADPGLAPGPTWLRYHLYRSVPPDVYGVCSEKIGQRASDDEEE